MRSEDVAVTPETDFETEPRLNRWKVALPYLALLGVALFCHGFLLTNDGRIWDSWFVFRWLKVGSWDAISEFFGSVGLPLYTWLYWPFRHARDIVGAFMWATFLCLWVGGSVTFRLGIILGALEPGEALALGALTLAMPLFLAAQDFIMFFFIFTHTLFLVAVLLMALSLYGRGWRHWVLRGVGVLGCIVSFSNAALLVYYGAFYVLLFLCYRRLHGSSFVAGAVRFGTRFPDFLLLPPLGWACRLIFTPQYGWYEHYNSIGTNLHKAGESLWSFVVNVVPFHLGRTLQWPLEHPIAAMLMVGAVLTWLKWAPRHWTTERGSVSALQFLAFGVGAMFLAVFPYAVAGKHFIASPLGEDSHHLLLTSLPAALLLLGVLRPFLWWRGAAASRLFAPVAACLVIVLGSQVTPAYVAERAEWVSCRSLLHNVSRNGVLRDSSVILILDRFSFTKQHAYEMYAFADAFGGLSRFVTHHVPANRRFYTPAEMLSTLQRTTVLPSEYDRIDPAGQQTLLKVERNRGGASDWDLVRRYHWLAWFGEQAQFDEYLSDLTTLHTQVLKLATPLQPGRLVGGDIASPKPGPPSGNFTNAVGMRLNFLPWGWWVGRSELTQQQFERVMGYNPSLFKDPSRPVECVSWNEAAAFCRRLTESERSAGRLPAGFVYRLPTVQEFDHLIAEGTQENAIIAGERTYWRTAPVGSLKPNSLGLYDVAGNVWEWCLDWWDFDHRFKISKGGAWSNTPGDLGPRPSGWNQADPYERAAADRLFGPQRRDYPNQGFWDRGFRVVLALAKPEPVSRSK